jgi:hypothetical protein
MTNHEESLSAKLWNTNFKLGLSSEEHANEKKSENKEAIVTKKFEDYTKAKDEQVKAEFWNKFIGEVEGAIPKKAPKQCPLGNSPISHLEKTQMIPKMIITPGSPIRRLIVVLPPGSGKTCIMLDILANFLNDDFNIIIVGDSDIFQSLSEDLRKCPAEANGQLLRDRNTGEDPFCVLNSNLIKKEKQNLDKNNNNNNCKGDKFKRNKIFWLDYVKFGTWLTSAGSAKGQSKFTVNPFSENTVIIMDEVHKMCVPGDEKTIGSDQQNALHVGRLIFEAGKNQEENPYIVGFTATPIIDDPVQAICLATIFKGHTDPAIFTDPEMTKLKIPPKDFYNTKLGFVEEVKSITVFEPGTHNPQQVPIKIIQDKLIQNKCMQMQDEKKENGKSKNISSIKKNALEGHPCPVGDGDRSKAITKVFKLKDKSIEPLGALFSNLFFIVDASKDPRKFPAIDSHERLVTPPPEYQQKIAMGAKETPTAAWSELSNFANPKWLKRYVTKRLKGNQHEPNDTVFIEANAPKWKALASDLKSSNTIAGKTAVYMGARDIKGVCSSSDFLFGLSFYLMEKNGYEDGTKESFEGRKEDKEKPDYLDVSHKKNFGSIYIFANMTDEKMMPKRNDDEKSYKAEDFPLLAGHTNFRKEQLKAFNDSSCVGSGGTSSANYAVLLLGDEAYKSINLSCVSNMIRLVVQPSGKGQQTTGRARRSCSFRNVFDPEDWMVKLMTYVIRVAECPNFDCDCILGSFYKAQAQLENQILQIMRGYSIGCTNFKNFSKWDNEVTCFLDKKHQASEMKPRANLFHCSYDGSPGANNGTLGPSPIKSNISGDASRELVIESANKFCGNDNTSLPNDTKQHRSHQHVIHIGESGHSLNQSNISGAASRDPVIKPPPRNTNFPKFGRFFKKTRRQISRQSRAPQISAT